MKSLHSDSRSFRTRAGLVLAAVLVLPRLCGAASLGVSTAAPVDAVPAFVEFEDLVAARNRIALARAPQGGQAERPPDQGIVRPNEPRKLRGNPLLRRAPRARLELPGGRVVIATRLSVNELGNGDFVWVGEVENHPFSRVTLASRSGVVGGIVDLPWQDGNEYFEIVPQPGGWSVLSAARPPGASPENDALLPPVPLRGTVESTGRQVRLAGRESVARAEDAGAATELNPSVVDVMVLYSTSARNRYGQAGIEANILTAVADANTAHRQSGVHVLLNLVHMAEVNDLGTTDLNTALNYLQNPFDGVMDEVAALRDQYQADVVSLVGEYTGAGVGYVMSPPTVAFEAYALSVVSSSYLWYYTLHHEIGHNFGNQHDRANALFGGAYLFSYGYKWCATDGSGFRTIMSYDCPSVPVPRLNYISNPRVFINGVPAGIAHEVDPANSADNARSMNLTGPIVQEFRVGSPPPSAPSNLTAQMVGATSVEVSWVDASSNEAGFRLERSTDQVAWSVVATLAANTTSFTDAGLTPEATYGYRVRAYNGGGFSPYSPTALVLLSSLPPAAPSGLTATAVSASRIDLAWTDNASTEQGIEVERSAGGGSWSLVATLPANATTWSDTSVVAGTSFGYRVRTTNVNGASAWSNEAFATPQMQPPVAPSNLVAVGLSAEHISLSWTDNATDETSQQLERSSDGVVWNSLATLSANVSTYEDQNLLPSTTYFYRLRACNDGGCSAFTLPASATTLPNPPAAPSGLTATAVSANQINLAWTDNAGDETGFKIERSVDGVSFAPLATVGANVTSYGDTGLPAGATRYYRVAAYHAGGDSAGSNVAGAITWNGSNTTVTYTSVGAEDGYITESSETSGQGGTVTSTSTSSTALRLGDDSSDRQFRVILSFDTSPLPDAATIVSATLRLRRGGVSGTTPFQTHGTCWADVKSGSGFGGATAIAAGDFQAAPDVARVASLSAAASNGSWSEGAISSSGLPFINRTGRTQFRLYFELDDNDDGGTDYIGYYSGDNSTSSNRPQLVVTYSTAVPSAPVAPVGLSATPGSATEITLTWQDAAADETGYEVERSADGVTWSLLTQLPANSAAHVDPGLLPEHTFHYRVRAFNANGYSAWSNVATATTLADVPAGPTGLVAQAVSETHIYLAWVDNALNETGYSVERSADGMGWVAWASLPANATAFEDVGLAAGSTWFYRVQAVNAIGGSSYSQTVSATTWTPNVAPVAVADAYSTPEDTPLTVPAPGLLVNDTDPNPEDALGVVSYTQPGFGAVTVSADGAFTYTPAPNYYGEDSFTYTISDGRGGTASAAVSLTVTPVPDLPVAPSGLVATAASTSSVNLTWADNANNETGFEVERSANSGASWIRTATLPAGTTAASDSGLTAATTYHYRVRATNADGASDWSNLATVTTLPNPPAAPSGLTATALSSSQINLAWTDNAGDETGFKIERSADGVSFTQIATVGANVTSYQNSGLPAGTTYHFRVRATNGGGDSVYSNTAQATTQGALVTVTFNPVSSEDGFIIEASETANAGSTAFPSDSNAGALRAGDNYSDREYRSIVSFDTSALPDGATIVSARLRLRRGVVLGTNPFDTHGTCWVDIKGGAGFNDSRALSKEDFEAPADGVKVGSLSKAATDGAWSEATVNAAGLAFINKTGRTQVRIYFNLDDNDDAGTDYIGWYSGENSNPENRPQLVVEYQ